jgi:hypothetical protein
MLFHAIEKNSWSYLHILETPNVSENNQRSSLLKKSKFQNNLHAYVSYKRTSLLQQVRKETDWVCQRCHDSQHNDIQHNDNQHSDNQQK